jgi:hypothetical protein
MQVKDMFPARYLRGQDMTKPILIELRSVELTELRAGPDKPAEPAYVLFFEDVSAGTPQPMRGLMHVRGKGHALVLRRALADEIMQATGVTDTDEWRGKRVVIYPEQRTVARRNVVSIRARAPKAHQQAPTPATPTEDAATDEVIEAT